MRHTGEWPGSIILRHGLSKATARPWNRDVPDAHLTLIRGTAGFLAECANHLQAMGIPAVASSPLPPSAARLWKEAGYQPFKRLDVFGRRLEGDFPDPAIAVTAERTPDWDAVERVDRDSFEPFWRLDTGGLQDAFTATPRSVLLTAGAPDLLGFSIVGVGSIAGYLQRIAVTPAAQGHGLGRSLVRASMRWAHHHGAKEMLLNALPNNETASGLYINEGFSQLDDHLHILRKA
ncbi:MAG: GNAT family N-acetyltransferase [Actinobacteria bacterium]|nr:GNAT family N-acetyltransferase [Actinomycetota bacterium]